MSPSGISDQALGRQYAADAKVSAARANLDASEKVRTAGRQTDGEVTINTGALDIAGWTDIKIGGGLDRIPATFDLGMTETYPGTVAHNLLQPGQGCRIEIGGDTVIVGWINRVVREIRPSGHSLRVQGRSRCQDLVDCSAMLPEMSINSVSVTELAQQLVKPFDGPIGIKAPDGNGSGRPYQFSVSLGQTPWELISQVAAYEGLLVHDDATGDLVVCKVGSTKMASGFRQGENVQEWGVSQADDDLYSVYIPVLNGQNSLAGYGADGNNAGQPVKDPMVKRFRPLVVVSGQSDAITGQPLAQKRAVWEATRRRGRAQSVQLVCDSWRDSAGTLWTHNVLAPLHLPATGVENATWLITEWGFVRDAQGTHASITLMPPDAFAVEPSVLNTVPAQVAEEVRKAALAKAGETQSGQSVSAPNGLATGASKAGREYGL